MIPYANYKSAYDALNELQAMLKMPPMMDLVSKQLWASTGHQSNLKIMDELTRRISKCQMELQIRGHDLPAVRCDVPEGSWENAW